jgi:subtilisin-like proprotein convertase family protein
MVDRDRSEGVAVRRAGLAVLLSLALLALAGSAPAATATYTSHQLHAAIPAGGTVTSSIRVPDPGPVSFAAVGVRIAHPHAADLTLTLVGPGGRKVVLSRHRGGIGADYGSGPKGCSGNLAWFESDALDPVSAEQAPFAGEQRPEQPLTSLYGSEARGRWTLRIDDAAVGGAGTLLCWQLELSRNVVSHDRLARRGVAVDLSYVERNSYFGRTHVTIRRHGRVALAAPLSRFACRDCPTSGLETLSTQPLRIRGLDGDGEPEVLVDLYTGGAHCCFYTVILRYDGGTYRGTVAFWGDPGYGLRDLDRNGRPELVTADDRFAYSFTFYAASFLPVRVESYDHGTLTDVTSSFPALVRADAASLWSEYLKIRRNRDDDVRGVLAAWVADEYRLGRADDAWRRIEAAYRRGELTAPRVDGTTWPAGRKYISALRAFLAGNGYGE